MRSNVTNKKNTTHRNRFSPIFLLLAGSVFPLLLLAQPAVPPSIALYETGEEFLVDYDDYGVFEDVGTHQFRYVIKDRQRLAKAVGSGIYPNENVVLRDPEFRRLNNEEKLNAPLAEYHAEHDPVITYYRWAAQTDLPQKGLRQYNIAVALEKAGLTKHALKAYYAIVVHFPREIVWQDNHPWYVGVSALDAVRRLTKDHPEWNIALVDAEIRVENGFDRKGVNDTFTIRPGHWETADRSATQKPREGRPTVVYHRGDVEWLQWPDHRWELRVRGKPFLIRGICYFPTPVGRSPDVNGYRPHVDWMTSDLNENGKIDGPYDAWVDANRNGKKDRAEKSVGDFQLMKEMGANTIRLYHHAENDELLTEAAQKFGLRFLMGDLLGAYTIGSNAVWEDGTDYGDLDQREAMRESVRDMVLRFRSKDYVLMWVLGNENNYGHGNNASEDPETYYEFANEIAELIHELDPTRPVALCNGDVEYLDLIARLCPAVDVLAVNAYRGEFGMGESFWESLSRVWRKPVFISEFGCPAFSAFSNRENAENYQAQYLLNNWDDIIAHAGVRGTGNAIGGVLFEWVDEWWKAGVHFEPWIQDTHSQAKGPFPDGKIYEEWLGLFSQGNGESSPYLRRPRAVYKAFKEGPWKVAMRFPAIKKSGRSNR